MKKSMCFPGTVRILTLLVTALLSAACQKGINPGSTIPDGDGTALTFSIDGIVGSEDETIQADGTSERVAKAKSPIHSYKNSPSSILAQQELSTDEGVDMLITLTEESSSVANEVYRASTTDSSVNKRAAQQVGKASANRENMEIGVAYRVVLYDTDDQYVATINAISGSEFTFRGAYRNKTYKWYAYSYGSREPYTGDFTAQGGTPFGARTESGMFLHDSGTLTTRDEANTNNKINILFKRKAAVIQLVVDARGMFTTITDVKARNNDPGQLRDKGTFNIKTGQLNRQSGWNIGTVAQVREYAQFSNFNTALYGDTIKYTNFYTLGGSYTMNNFGVVLEQVSLYSYNQALTSPRVFQNISHILEGATMAPEEGKIYRITLSLIASGLRVGNANEPGSAIWARSNLYRGRGSSLANYNYAYHFRFYNSNHFQTNRRRHSNEYWNWRALNRNFDSTPNQGDPCQQVYPYRRWRLPNRQEAQYLVDRSANFVFGQNPGQTSPSGNQAYRYARWDLGGTATPYGPNYLELHQYGYRDVWNGTTPYPGDPWNGNSPTDPNINELTASPSAQSNGYYWTSAESNNSSSNAVFLGIRSEADGSGLLYLNNMPKGAGLNVRCVRNEAFNSSTITPL